MGAHTKARRWRRGKSTGVACLLVAAGLLWAAAPSQAVHDTGVFELDGNTVNNGNATWDWNNLFDASGNRIVTPDPINGPLLGSTFLHDSAEPDQSYFTSNKDIQPIASGQQHWGCDPINNPLDKDNLLNAYAALVKVPANGSPEAGHTVLYLGSERGSNNGTSFAGFWLLKDSSVGCSGSANFSGHHTDGDLLIVSDYTNGGGTQDVSVYRWNGTDAAGSLGASPILTGARCDVVGAGDAACAIANSVTITTPWTPTTHVSNTFVETGIDLTQLFSTQGSGGAACFTTFLAETRSSAELTATLKDFAGGQLNTCAPPAISTSATPGGSLNAPGTAQHDTVSVGTAQVPATGSVDFFLCQPNQVTAGGCEGNAGTKVGSSATLDASGNGTSGTVDGNTTPNDNTPGKYCWRAVYTPAASETHYVGTTHTNATVKDADHPNGECFVIVHGTPSITTQISVTPVNGGPTPGLGFTALGDTATLHNFVGSVAGETITFNLYDVTANPGCGGSPVFTTTGLLDAGGSATTSGTYTPVAAHTFTWIASYPGDALNDPIAGTCADANESATIVGAHIDVSKSANPPGPVSAGQTIGFDITVSNQGAIPATHVSVTDNLPAHANGAASGTLDWSLVPPYTGCSITGSVGSQVLNCPDLGTLAPSSSFPVIHVQSSTSPADCGVVSNKATVATSNGTGGDSDVATVTVLCPNLSLTKQADNDTVNAGSQIGFTITASNAGPGSALGATLHDPLPAGSGVNWSISPAYPGPGTCSISGAVGSQVLDCSFGDLAANASASVHIVSGTAFASCKTYHNEATLSATNAADVTASDDTTVLCPDLHIGKVADADAVNAGTDIGFTITASNTGAGDATGALINDPLPTGPGISWSIQSQSGPLTCGIASNVLTCTGTLGAGATETVHITSHTSFVSCGTYNNTATLTATNSPQAPQGSDSEDVLCADLVIHKTADADSVSVGSNIGFTVTITNNGSGAANGVDVEDPLPAGQGIDWSINSSTGPLTCSIQGSPPSETLKCTGDLAASGNAGDSQSVHVTSSTVWNADLNSCGTYDNTATVTWSNGPADPISSNLASEDVLCPSLNVVKQADADTVSAGDNIGFSVHVTNGGPGTATGVTLHDPLPAGTDVSWSIDPAYSGPGACGISGAVGSQVLDCAFGDLAPDADITIHIVSATTFNSCAAYDNTATLHATNEPGLESSATTTVLCPDVSLEKTADAAVVNAGEQIGFTVTASNSDAEGTGTAHDVVINDPLPGGEGVNWSIDSGPDNCAITGTAPDQTLECSAVDLAPGESESVHVVSDTEFASCGTYDNTATLTLSNGAGPLTADASTEVDCPTLALVKTADDPSVKAGGQIGFTITVTNDGPGTAKNAALTDPLPKGGDVSWSIDPAETTALGCEVSDGGNGQVLSCALGDLGATASVAVHLISATTSSSCATYPNVATLNASNAPELTAQASTRVTNCLGTAPKPPVAVTGVQQLGWQITWGVAFLVMGGFILVMARRRVPPHSH